MLNSQRTAILPGNDLLQLAIEDARNQHFKLAIKKISKITKSKADSVTKAKALSLHGAILISLKQFDTAVSVLKRALALNPGDQIVLTHLSSCHREEGNLETSISLAREAVNLGPQHFQANMELALTLMTKRHFDEAIQYFVACSEIDATQLDPYLNLGDIHLKEGRPHQAIKAYEAALRIDNQLPLTLLNRGNAYHDIGENQKSINSYLEALAIDPLQAKAYFNLGVVFDDSGRYQKAIDSYGKALKIEPNYIDALYNQAITLKTVGEFSKSESNLRKCLEANSNHQDAINALAIVLLKKGELESSIKFCNERLALHPNDALTLNNLGLAHKQNGDLDKAKDTFYSALEINPLFAEAHCNLSTVNVVSTDSKIVELAQQAHQNVDSDHELMLMEFTLGKLHKDLRQFESAFDFFSSANNRKLKSLKWSRPDYSELSNSLLKVNEKLSQANSETSSSFFTKPIFIVGLPRSGSTLVESILSRAPEIQDLGETRALEKSIKLVETESDPKDISLESIRSDYLRLAKLRGDSDAGVGYQGFTDKMLYNFQYCEAIFNIFPNAKVIHTFRNIMDNVLSVFTTLFSEKNEWTYNLEEIVEYCAFYNRMMNHWNERFEDRIFQCDYDQLVNNPRRTVEKLTDFCELDWTDEFLTPEQSKRRVATASAFQVRKPISNGSVNGWLNYEPQLSEVSSELKKRCLIDNLEH